HPLAVELAGDLGAEDGRQVRRLRIPTGANQHVHEVDPGGTDVEHDTLRLLDLPDVELVRPPGPFEDDRPQRLSRSELGRTAREAPSCGTFRRTSSGSRRRTRNGREATTSRSSAQ